MHPMTYQNALKVLDFGASATRQATEQDLITHVRLGSAMPEVKIVCAPCWPQDLPEPLQGLCTVAHLVSNTTKHVRGSPHNLDEVQIWVDLAQIASGDTDLARRPTVHFGLSPTSPLQLDHDSAEVLMYLARKGLPFCVTSCPMAGATSPLTLAGTLLLANAEHLFLLTLAQLVREGTPIIIGGAAGTIDLRTGELSYGCPERHLILGASIELANHYGLPHHSPAGSVDSWYPDIQSGAEKMLTWITRLLKGAVLGIAFGSLRTGSTVSLEQMVIDADLLRSAERVLQGLHVDEETLALEAIERVGPGGDFLMDSHTLVWMRKEEHYRSRLVNRDGARGPDMVARAHAEVERLLDSHHSTVPLSVVEEINRYVAERSQAARLKVS
jgi:trimethylamine--corrinoid protein Co-methyltransferase